MQDKGGRSGGLLGSLLMRSVKPNDPEQPTRSRNIQWALWAVGMLVFALVPFFLDVDRSYVGYYLFIVFDYIILAQGWNLIAGYTGQISLGGNTFLGLGAYTTGIIWLRDITHTGYYFDPFLMLLSGLVRAV